MTTRAAFQKSESVGYPSASVSIARRSWSSFSDRTRSQSLRAFIDRVPIRLSFMSLRLPSRDDSPLTIGQIHVDHCDLNTIRDANGINAGFPILKAIIHSLQRPTFENLDGVLKSNSVTRNN